MPLQRVTIDQVRRGQLGTEFVSMEGRLSALETENALLRALVEGLERRMADLARSITVGAAGDVNINAAALNVNCPMAAFSGVVRCDTVIANTVMGTSYTPGAGNIY